MSDTFDDLFDAMVGIVLEQKELLTGGSPVTVLRLGPFCPSCGGSLLRGERVAVCTECGSQVES